MRVELYHESQIEMWDEFVCKSKNGTFLFLRDYMDYHRGRFVDHSVLVWDDKGQLIALLPANMKDDTLVSHGGLTYGGFVTDGRMKATVMLEVFECTLAFLKRVGFARLVYKAIPHIYHRLPAEEDNYALFRCGAVLYRRDVTTAAVPALTTEWQERRVRSMKKARAAGVTWCASDDYERFWHILEYNLATVHNLKPVHTLAEIQSLHSRFSENIKLFTAFLGSEMVAGTVIYESSQVAHAQYTASSEKGRLDGALDLLFLYLLRDVYKNKSYFDFGVSTEAEGKYLNPGLVEFKEGFGARTVTHDFYEITLV
jgi:Acetyltransferase (GNAT) domain